MDHIAASTVICLTNDSVYREREGINIS
jgi:hypothetical protein